MSAAPLTPVSPPRRIRAITPASEIAVDEGLIELRSAFKLLAAQLKGKVDDEELTGIAFKLRDAGLPDLDFLFTLTTDEAFDLFSACDLEAATCRCLLSKLPLATMPNIEELETGRSLSRFLRTLHPLLAGTKGKMKDVSGIDDLRGQSGRKLRRLCKDLTTMQRILFVSRVSLAVDV